jgi:hypothetical protein
MIVRHIRANPPRLLLLALCCGLMACGSPASDPPTSPSTSPGPGVPAGETAGWGFFAYTPDLFSGLSNLRWSRATGVVWTLLEPLPGTGNYDWSETDMLVRSAQTGGVNRVFAIKSGNGASFSDPGCFRRVVSAAAAGLLPDGQGLASCPIRAEMESAWSRMVTELVERYDADGNRDMPGLSGGIRVDIEVDNEAVMQQYWDYGESDRTVSADRYLRLLELSYRAKQAANPQTQVILTGFFQTNLVARCDGRPVSSVCSAETLQNVAFTKRVLTRPDLFDAIDVHCFAYYHFEPDWVDAAFQWVIGQMQQRGYQRPMYSLEWTGANMLPVAFEGYSDEFRDYFPYSASFPSTAAFQAMYVGLDQPGNVTYRQWFEAEQAKEFAKIFTNMLALGVSRLVHVQYTDYYAGSAWSNTYWNWQGVIKYVGGAPIRKPSYYAYNALSERLFGFTAARRAGQGGAVRLYEFTFPAKEPAYVLWTDGASGVLDLSSAIARRNVQVTYLVTELGAGNEPIVRPPQTVPATAVPVGDVPVLLRGVD